MDTTNRTPFIAVYDKFLSKVTDDMYMELTELDTYGMLEELLVSAIPLFEFPRVNIHDYECRYESDEGYYCGAESDYMEAEIVLYEGGYFNVQLTEEEINILATYMVAEWVGQQLASVENVRMKYSGTDFKFTSQANHISKLLNLKEQYTAEGFHLQRLYKRRAPRKDSAGWRSTMDMIMEEYPER